MENGLYFKVILMRGDTKLFESQAPMERTTNFELPDPLYYIKDGKEFKLNGYMLTPYWNFVRNIGPWDKLS